LEAGASEKRAAWIVEGCGKMADSDLIHLREFREGPGRLAISLELLVYVRPYLGPLFSWRSALPLGSCVAPPSMLSTMPERISSEVKDSRATSFIKEVVRLGERFRADAEAEGQDVALGGWEVNNRDDITASRWYPLRILGRSDIPWA
jgi:hypothetical protein